MYALVLFNFTWMKWLVLNQVLFWDVRYHAKHHVLIPRFVISIIQHIVEDRGRFDLIERGQSIQAGVCDPEYAVLVRDSGCWRFAFYPATRPPMRNNETDRQFINRILCFTRHPRTFENDPRIRPGPTEGTFYPPQIITIRASSMDGRIDILHEERASANPNRPFQRGLMLSSGFWARLWMIDEDVAVTAAEKLVFDWQDVVRSDSLLQ